jgi:hypothetical protein
MDVLLSVSIITCSQALNILNNITKVVGLTHMQKIEIISELRKTIPTCPVKIQENKNLLKQ